MSSTSTDHRFKDTLFPIQDFVLGFTTCPSAPALPNLMNATLSDSALGIHKNTGKLTHNVVCPPPPIRPSSHPEPQLAWEARYPKGSCSPKTPLPGGLGFYLAGPKTFSNALERGAGEAVFSYRMMLQKDWEWVKGGKLPGAYGGVGELAYRCSGGRQHDRCKCFNLRLMWRENGMGELYAYTPLNETNKSALLAVPPFSKTNSDYGISVGKGAWTYEPGVWTTIAERVKLNTVGEANGEVQVWINGDCVIHARGLVLRVDEESHIKGMHFQTFFGGHTPDWASPKDQHAWFADVSGVIVH
ncbi:polysaccharide lyase family 14 protein [Pisolithus orientalis]|uniref:polysaccharide lyase family 14 protein n=1 Tax=Pisolithus orientalis TaxID=936130 RepID=UPI00222563BD|nr:polysaccharide lyase family 14 protein [Pisolithus orientalis]XP_051600128.1 polysaccharide lyase family 14 protein [Pisolithus orientalis]KAI5987349.1 polysaccharide lyase family 14 protein [Pisolithus orientalis]KAI6007539.1 polysaccharide lyase family 14 protein [Pisolithus orientalis]